jgi:uncharacterized membrane protein
MTKKKIIILCCVTVFIIHAVVLYNISNKNKQKEDKIYNVAVECIEENINYPSTLKMGYYEIKEQDNNYVLFYCNFKCKNSYGFELKYKAVVKINVASDKYFATDFRFLENN